MHSCMGRGGSRVHPGNCKGLNSLYNCTGLAHTGNRKKLAVEWVGAKDQVAPEGGDFGRGVSQQEVLLGEGCPRRELQQTPGVL